MMGESWKCYRCNLYFKNKKISQVHKDVTNHSVLRVKTLAV